MIEKQVIVSWYTPEEKKPEPCVFVVATVSAKLDRVTYDHAMVIADWCDDEDGWWFHDETLERNHDNVTVHAWADLEPYGGQR